MITKLEIYIITTLIILIGLIIVTIMYFVLIKIIKSISFRIRKEIDRSIVEIRSDLMNLTQNLSMLQSDLSYLKGKTDNNIQAELLNEYYKFFEHIDTKNPAAKGLSQHLRMKIDFVVSAYNEVKNHYKIHRNFAILSHGGFSTALLGSGSGDLFSRYAFYPAEFLALIDPINEGHYNEFKEAIMMDIRTPHDDMLSVLKSNAIGIFSKNVSAILSVYRQYERDIQDPNYTVKPIHSRKTHTKRDIKQLIAEKVAENKYKEALDILERNAKDDDMQDEVIQQKSILSSIQRNRRNGIDQGIEAENRIRQVILELAAI